MKYVITIQLKRCLICKVLCGPEAGEDCIIGLKDGDEIVEKKECFLCHECMELLNEKRLFLLFDNVFVFDLTGNIRLSASVNRGV